MKYLQDFRNILKEIIKQNLVQEPIALLFSGGTDSLTILWSLLDLGVEVTCYTFQLERVQSTDSKVAQLVAKTWGIPLQLVVIPYQKITELVQELEEVIRLIQSTRKTHVEVMWAYWHLIQHIKEQQIWSGLQADTLYGSSKSMAIKYAKNPVAFNKARQKMIANLDQEGWLQANKLARYFNKELQTPYTSPEIRDFMLRYSWTQLNRPKQKMPAVIGFEQEFKTIPIYRHNNSLQCGSGIREYMQRLLADKSINRNNHNQVVALYKELA